MVAVETPHELSALLRGARLRQRYTQDQVAQMAGVSRKWVSDFERGKTSVDLTVLLRLLPILSLEMWITDIGEGRETRDQRRPDVMRVVKGAQEPARPSVDLDTYLEGFVDR